MGLSFKVKVISYLVPNLTLDFALDLADLSDKSFAVGEANYSVAVWLKLHEVEPNKIFDFNSDEDCQLLKSIIYQEDEVYLTKLQQLVEKVGDTADGLSQVKSLLAGWQSLKRWGDGIPSLSDLEEVEVEINEEPEETEETDLELLIFSFETVIFDTKEKFKRITTITKQSNYFKEVIPKDLELEMVAIPEGKFNFESNYKKIEIGIKPFYIGKYLITQKQWRIVSSLPKVNDFLLPSPNPNGQDNFPVTCVTWYDAIEFCLRLSNITGKNYILPSETQWEYACRAGTNTTSSFFGPSIDGYIKTNELFNCFIQSYKYCSHPTGLDKWFMISSVGSFPPNAFGLYDMYGNVWEWCADIWHDNCEDIPKDGTPWLDGNTDLQKVVEQCSKEEQILEYGEDLFYSDEELFVEKYANRIWENAKTRKKKLEEAFVVRGGAYNSEPSICNSVHRKAHRAFRQRYYDVIDGTRFKTGKKGFLDVGFRVACTFEN